MHISLQFGALVKSKAQQGKERRVQIVSAPPTRPETELSSIKGTLGNSIALSWWLKKNPADLAVSNELSEWDSFHQKLHQKLFESLSTVCAYGGVQSRQAKVCSPFGYPIITRVGNIQGTSRKHTI